MNKVFLLISFGFILVEWYLVLFSFCLQIYVDYEIPAENKYLYCYLQNAYATDAFIDTCPSDPVIINHYQKKAQKRGVEATLMKETTTLHIPDYIDLTFDEEDEAIQDNVEQLSEQVDGIVVDSTPNGDAASDGPEANGDDTDDAASSAPAPEELVANGDVSSAAEEKYEPEVMAPAEEADESKSVVDETPEKVALQISENGSAVAAE